MGATIPDRSVPPFLRWAGSKRKLLSKLRPYWDHGSFRRYVEPFMGSACLFFELQPERAILSDMNRQLVETFQAVSRYPRAISQRLVRLSRSESAYYKMRALKPETLPYLDRAVRFVFLNRYCFNGIYRTNNSGEFNVPFGGERTGNVPSEEAIVRCSELLKRASIQSGDFETLVRSTVAKRDFVYLDPPYAVSNRRIHTQYNAHSFGLDDLRRLAGLLRWIDGAGAAFVLSYADSKETRDIFSSWPMRAIYTRRHVAGFTKHRARARELLISNIT